jgi:hypothetical protein
MNLIKEALHRAAAAADVFLKSEASRRRRCRCFFKK